MTSSKPWRIWGISTENSCIDSLTSIDGIGPKKAEEIKEVLEQHSLRTKLSNEEYFLVNIIANENNSELIKKF